MRITVACGEALISDANNLAMVLAKSEADNLTYRDPTWQDANGNVYAVTSFEVTEDWVNRAQSPLVRPDWDVNDFIDMGAANRAQAALVFEAVPNIPTADPTALTALAGPSAREALILMGLTRLPLEPLPEEP